LGQRLPRVPRASRRVTAWGEGGGQISTALSPRTGGPGSYARSSIFLQGKAHLAASANVRFSNRPFGVKHFQTIHLCGVDVTHGLVLLFGIGTWGPSSMGSEDEAEQSVGRPCRQCETTGPSGHTNSPHPSSREGHLSTARWSSCFLLSGLVLNCFMLLRPRLSPGSTGTLCRQPRCGA
jgi:hypothetical protein